MNDRIRDLERQQRDLDAHTTAEDTRIRLAQLEKQRDDTNAAIDEAMTAKNYNTARKLKAELESLRLPLLTAEAEDHEAQARDCMRRADTHTQSAEELKQPAAEAQAAAEKAQAAARKATRAYTAQLDGAKYERDEARRWSREAKQLRKEIDAQMQLEIYGPPEPEREGREPVDLSGFHMMPGIPAGKDV